MAKTAAYFRYAPANHAPGFNPLIGTVEPDTIYEIPTHLVARFERAGDWVSAKKSDGSPRTKRKV